MNSKAGIMNILKLLGTGLILIWLFVRSPFNPLFQEFTDHEKSYAYLDFIYWILFSAVLLWIVYFINRSNYKKHLLKIFISILSLYYLCIIPSGFEVTDTGYHLSKQWSMLHGMWEENFDAIAGTNFFGGIWLLIAGGPFLLWARVGFVLVQIMIALYSYKILAIYFEEKKVFAVITVLSIVFSDWQTYYTINYDNLPLLFIIAAFYYMLSQKSDKQYSAKKYILPGILISLAVFCKISVLAGIIPVPAVYFLSGSKSERKSSFYKFAAGLMIGFSAIFLLIFATDASGLYSDELTRLINDLFNSTSKIHVKTQDHSFTTLFALYNSSFLHGVTNSVNLSILILLFSVILNRTKKNIYIFTAAGIVVLWTLYAVLFSNLAENNLSMNLYQRSVKILSLFFSLTTLWVIQFKTIDLHKYSPLFYSACIIFILSFIGSDLGIMTGFRAGSGILLVGMAILMIHEKTLLFKEINIKFDLVLYTILVILILSFLISDTKRYREFENRFLTHKFTSRQLIGIKSNPKRVDVVDSLMVYLNNIPDIKNRRIFFAKHSPLLYYLTSANYPLTFPLEALNPLKSMRSNFTLYPPEYFVMPGGSPRNDLWPLKNENWRKETFEQIAAEYYDFYDEFIKSNNYIEVYKNSFYTVYSLGKEEKGHEQITE